MQMSVRFYVRQIDKFIDNADSANVQNPEQEQWLTAYANFKLRIYFENEREIVINQNEIQGMHTLTI